MSALLGKLNWGAWLYGLGSGFIGGGAGAVTAGVAVGIMDPAKFALGGSNSLKLMGTCFVVNGVFNAFNYLKVHPLPEEEKADAAGSGK